MNRFSILFFAVFTIAFGCVAQALPSNAPNVLVLFSDQHRMADFPGEPHTSVIAPNLDRLSQQGVRFHNAISNYPVCSPFRGMLLTGLAPYRSGVIDNNEPVKDPGTAMAHAFKKAGYHTGYIGKWHLQMKQNTHVAPFGFDESRIWANTNSHYKSRYLDTDKNEWIDYKDYNAFGMSEHAVDFIERNQKKPFLLYVSYNPPHSNFFDAPEEFRAHFNDRELKQRPNVMEMTEQYALLAKRGWNDTTLAGYLAHIEALDHAIGSVLDTLDRLNLSENTIVVYTSDHGEMMLSHGRGGKRVPYEESIRIPFLIRWPNGIKAGQHVKAPFGTIDVVPTLLSLAGLEQLPNLNGYDFSATVTEGAKAPVKAQPIMHIQKSNASHGDNHPSEKFRGIRTERYTYAVKEDGPWILFDNKKDPYQLNNIIDKKKKVAAKLDVQMREWLKEYDDPF